MFCFLRSSAGSVPGPSGYLHCSTTSALPTPTLSGKSPRSAGGLGGEVTWALLGPWGACRARAAAGRGLLRSRRRALIAPSQDREREAGKPGTRGTLPGASYDPSLGVLDAEVTPPCPSHAAPLNLHTSHVFRDIIKCTGRAAQLPPGPAQRVWKEMGGLCGLPPLSGGSAVVGTHPTKIPVTNKVLHKW